MRSTIWLMLLTISSSSSYAADIRIDLTDLQMLVDTDIDGTVNRVEDGFYPYGSNTVLSYGAGVLAKETTSLCGVGSGSCSSRYVKVPFAEYDISGLNDPIDSASLNFTRFFSNSWERAGQIQVSGYAADGVVTIADYSIATHILGVSDPAPIDGSSQSISIDITEYLRSVSGDFVGIRFDMTARGGARLLDNTYQGSEDWLTNTPAPYLSVVTSEVPLPAAVWLFGSGLFGLVVATKRGKAA